MFQITSREQLLIKKKNKRTYKLAKRFWEVVTILVMIGCLGYTGYRLYEGPTLSPHTRIGFYGHGHLQSFKSAGMSERKASSKIYISKSKMDWNKPIRTERTTYYFPKDMPLYTRHYLISHVRNQL